MRATVRPRLARAFFSILLFGLALAVSACVRETKTANQTGGQASASPARSAPATTSPASGTATPAGTRATLPSLDGRYLPLWPFAGGSEVRAWEASYRSGGHQPWHLSAQQTALSFTQGYLGYHEIDRVAASTIRGADARIAVGYRNPDSGRVGTAAVIHLVRFGSGPLAPWEVVGTDDTTFSLTTPAYGARVGTRAAVGGHITGVDESIRVQARQQPSRALVGEFSSLPAGGQNQPWSVTLTLRGGSPGVLTIAAATGGHVVGVERFTITGVVR